MSAAVNPRINLKLLVMVGQETEMVGKCPPPPLVTSLYVIKYCHAFVRKIYHKGVCRQHKVKPSVQETP